MNSVSHFQKMKGTPKGEISKEIKGLDNTINQLN